MTHDPLCPEYGRDYGDCFSQSFSDAFCQCALIAEVRADQRDKAVQRVEQNVLVGMTLTPKEVCAVIAAVRGES